MLADFSRCWRRFLSKIYKFLYALYLVVYLLSLLYLVKEEQRNVDMVVGNLNKHYSEHNPDA